MRFWSRGRGRWGSVFSRDDFTDREVKDTDGDGLPEFVDAWGQPLQFFRWPVLYHSDLQRGQVILPDPNSANSYDLLPPYQMYDSTTANANFGAVFQERERDPLDPNQQLTAPQWWARLGVGGQLAANDNSPFAGSWPPAASLGASGGVQAFEYFFHRLTEPVSLPAGGRLVLGPQRQLRAASLLHQVPDSFGRPRQAARGVSLRRCGYEAAGRRRGCRT